jgi:hypothetical protein
MTGKAMTGRKGLTTGHTEITGGRKVPCSLCVLCVLCGDFFLSPSPYPLPQGERGYFRHCERPKGARQSSLCFWIASSAHKIPGFLAMTKKSFVASCLRGEFFFLFPPSPRPSPTRGEDFRRRTLNQFAQTLLGDHKHRKIGRSGLDQIFDQSKAMPRLWAMFRDPAVQCVFLRSGFA